MRKLLTGVLHTAAPNERVLPWATKNNKPLDKHGCPTRVTKIEWLCQSTRRSEQTLRAHLPPAPVLCNAP